MAKGKRSSLPVRGLSTALRRLAGAFDAVPIIYATGSRKPLSLFGTQIAIDVLPVIAGHLGHIGQVKRIALVLQTTGGSIDTPWPLVNMLRVHADELYVLVSEYALSAGTLIALGADKIGMSRHAFLSPVDPTSSRQIEGKPRDIAVEDVLGYVEFIADRVGVKDQSALVESLRPLIEEVKATNLGSIHRTSELIRRLSTNLLKLHLTLQKNQSQIEQIVDFLTHGLYTHSHLIPRNEAKQVIGFGDIVLELSSRQEAAIGAVYKVITSELQSNEPFAPEQILGKKDKREIKSRRALIYSEHGCDAFVSSYRLAKADDGQIQVQTIGQGLWQRISSKR